MKQAKVNGDNNAGELSTNQKLLPHLVIIISILMPLLVVVSVLLLKLAHFYVMDSDPLWSIAVGEWINTHRTVPYVDVFSWTVAGEQWYSNSWLFCWLIYITDQSLGYLGIALIMLIPCLVTGYFLFFMCKNYHDSHFAYLAFLAGISLLIFIAISPRALIYTFPFVAIIMYLIRFKLDSKIIYVIPLIMFLWANIQSSMRFGVMILFVEALVGTIFFKDRRLWPVVGLSFLATLMNPYGFDFWNISFAGFFTPGFQYVTEWRSPDFNNMYILILYLALFLIALLGAFRIKDDLGHKVIDRNRIMILFWFWAALLYSLTTVRAVHYVLLLLGPCFAAIATKSLDENRYLKPAIFIMVILLFLTSLTTTLPLLPLENDPESGKPVSFVEYLQVNPVLHDEVAHIIPNEATEFLKDNPVMLDRLFNSFIFGGYLLMTDVEVFIDARSTVFLRQDVFDDYIKMTNIVIKPETIIEKYEINTFLLSKNERLVFYLDLHPEWNKKYEDDIAVIYSKIDLD